MKKLLTLVLGVAFLVGSSGSGLAQPSPTMYTLGGIYDYLMEGVVPLKGGHSLRPPTGAVPGDVRFKSLEQILDDIKSQLKLAEASVEDVAEGVTFWSTQSDSWGLQTGEMAVGFRGLVSTGQTTSYDKYDDGYFQKGQTHDYTTNDDGTVTDNVTGLMWPADALDEGCFSGGSEQWALMIGWAEDLNFAGYSDWRLPNAIELMSLLEYEPESKPRINKTHFINTISKPYWTSTTLASDSSAAFLCSFETANTSNISKTANYNIYVRAVRDSQ